MKKIIGTLLAAMFVSVAAFAINCKRTVSVISATEMRVEITVNKHGINGIARLTESIPEGAVIKYTKSEGGSFDVANNKIKFVWMSLPSADNMTVAYVINTEKLNQGSYSLSGKFAYVVGNSTYVFSLDTSSFFVSVTNEVKLTNAHSATASLPASNENKIQSAPAKTSKVVYGIQVASTQKQLPGNYFSANYNINDKIKIETANGQFKYVLGEFNDMNTAKNFRKTLIEKGVKDPFIVAFLNNQRISMEEAAKLETTPK
ncbi:MAG: hypothetical protein ACHQHP_04060 [Bacteroidia bacterium]